MPVKRGELGEGRGVFKLLVDQSIQGLTLCALGIEAQRHTQCTCYFEALTIHGRLILEVRITAQIPEIQRNP